jgi:hypothetical protein
VGQSSLQQSCMPLALALPKAKGKRSVVLQCSAVQCSAAESVASLACCRRDALQRISLQRDALRVASLLHLSCISPASLLHLSCISPAGRDAAYGSSMQRSAAFLPAAQIFDPAGTESYLETHRDRHWFAPIPSPRTKWREPQEY